MRIGGAIERPYDSPKQWLEHVREMTYSAVVFPVNSDAPKQARRDYLACARDNDLLIGEVGIWKNCFAQDPRERAEAMEWSIRQLELAEEVGANCCVNISGSLSTVWDGYHPGQHRQETYDMVVETTQRILDAVRPTNTRYTLEPMPWMIPDSPEQYLDLIRDVDRPGFGVHLDYANMISGVHRYREASAFIDHCFSLLGEHIVSIHAKDLMLRQGRLPVCIEEVLPGTGEIDYALVLRNAHALGDDVPVFIEHLSTQEEYAMGIAHLRAVAREIGVPVK